MLHIRVIGAQCLPVPTKKVRKTKICCFSYSSCRYFYESFKSRENTTEPKWNGEFDVDIFRATDLAFTIFSSHLFTKDVFLGRVDINILEFLSQPAGKQILSNPHSTAQYPFPITCCETSNPTLLLSFSYSPPVFRPIEFKDIQNPTIHMWATFDPPYNNSENIQLPVEIELLRILPSNDRKTGDLNVFFTNFNKYTTWDAVGYSSNFNVFPSSGGPAQVHTFSLERINKCYEFFILNDNDYTGTVTLNFIEEKKEKTKKFKDGIYFYPNTDKEQIGVLKTVSVKVVPNKKFCCPIYMFFEKKTMSKKLEFVEFPSIEFDKEKMPKENDQSVEYSDIMSSQIPFHKEIIQNIKNTINVFKDSNFIQLNSLTIEEPISLQKTIKDLNIDSIMHIKIYIGGSTTELQRQNSNLQPISNYWEPKFIIFDSKNGSRRPEISDSLEKDPLKETDFHSGKKIQGFLAHTVVNLDLNQIGNDKIILFIIKCNSTLESANPAGFYIISHFDGNHENILFRKPLYVEHDRAHGVLCLRFEYIKDDWKIIPMRHYFNEEKEMNSIVDDLHENKWMTSETMVSHSNGIILSDDSENDDDE